MPNGPKILIVDDEPQIRRFLRVSLGAHQFHVVEAETGDDAIKTCAAEQPELTIMYLGMPHMDGLAVIARIRDRSTLPFLVLVVRADEADQVDGRARGARD